MKNLIKNNWMSFLLIAITLAWGYLQINTLPEQVPVHFDLNGVADRFGSKYYALVIMPAVSLFIVFLVHGMLSVSPKAFAAGQSSAGIQKLIFGIVIFLSSIQFAMIKEAVEPQQWIIKILPFSLSILCIILGNYIAKIEKNFVIGFRIPWTLASDDNWKKTHRFGGRAYVTLGFISLITVCFVHNILIPVAALVIASVAATIYSYIYFKKYELNSSDV